MTCIPSSDILPEELEALAEIYTTSLSHLSANVITLSLPVRLDDGFGVRLVLPDGTPLPNTLPVLPHVVLTIRFVPHYPSRKPQVHVNCQYASLEALLALVGALDNAFVEGEQCVFEWATIVEAFVTDTVLEQEETEYVLRLVEDRIGDAGDFRVKRVRRTSMEVVRELQIFARRELATKVVKGWWKCDSCWELVMGTKCMGLMACGHVGCIQCFKGFWEGRIKEGKVGGGDLVCMKEGCGGSAGVEEVRRVVSVDSFERYDAFLMERVFAGEGVIRCARCEGMGFVDGDLGRCGVCEFAFCVNCGKGWHGGGQCVNEEEVDKLVERYEQVEEEDREKMKEEVKGTVSESVWERVELRHALGQLKVKLCPDCGNGMMKNGGCSHMKCICGCDFCWTCMQVLDRYMEHYRPGGGTCDLYDTEDEQAAHEMIWNWVFNGT